MTAIKEALLHSHHGHSHAHPVSFFARLDARAVLVSWFMYTMLLISVPKFDLTGVLVFAAIPLFLIAASGVPIQPIIKRLLIISPFILLSAAANPFFDRRPLLEIAGLTISSGTISGLVILLKALVSVLTILTIAACMPFDHICHALRKLHAPEAFTTQLMLLHRYTFVLADEAHSMRQARDLRSFNGKGKGIGVTARLIGSLLLRSMARATRIHDAMLSRGFHGTVSCCQAERAFGSADAAFTTITIGSFLIMRVIF
ncbi:MAG: cobalt ECF transporter T component CbiQ [Candidatus Raymondbacteria bacterium RifOxyA12_full_50_37]|uniref:Cobalt ECF transporter T component CbiQ n=1 Tax=Candidatus Raymondbacteria bacterium RIFOXYD12_FULL_49_13 TaxID=1817890 RepID=A0A1F7F2I2_UNCRA|nr:MAG: cobalt ECF transporter T component CbiQ [Candidatus Raymondbacteria bacterium RifOxyA12_full_50_37]OGJ88635.1 MAG: cobalt ECF transporter T component CbiQ [Candidatus Raymondbacteria bacterium RIFOXYA2_FULL_49_16]OGJ90513.1 MAG: cobalt ECF transporter T component CbiQ [Candidatus Raymondbacteria bacterium RifOxyB12_full_50_8]OGK00808.1 MAG: cobalt ECF transporter T component CbiQ [Candidatus Raymondbacteria bacterium RIFOXYD12_FULL_49_13]OGK02889.1 MAG: cobalt ECF transporter T componen